MKIYRHQTESEAPYELVFEVVEPSGFNDRYVGRNAMMPSPFGIERLRIGEEIVLEWSERAMMLGAKNEDGTFKHESMRLNLGDLKFFGGLLLYFADTTSEEIHRMVPNNPPTNELFGIRRVEGKIAADMASQIIQRGIKVPRLWTPANRHPVGFTAR